ncbi:sensor domain-containing diguanylate cyclase [Alteromonas gilva]|uniref:diguanylate cyclase n=1 Tax=Alteromonas gilva TaxID=2987522 RepID=A0ABT5L5Y3_9ALTE|nr:sensor domain-containing diguanylate cyclase [Alteromonas gilva]MDC8832473.1 sensor domain-containing diguanylate cyclase [Alteromonas gilva]
MNKNDIALILHSLPVCALFMGTNEQVIQLNNEMARAFGLVNRNVLELNEVRICDSDTQDELVGVLAPLADSEADAVMCRKVIVHIRGWSQPCIMKRSLFEYNGDSWLVMCLHLPGEQVTSGEEGNIEVTRHIEFNQLLTQFSSKLINASANELDVIIDQSLAAFGVFCGVDRCYLFEFSDDSTTMSNTHEWVAPHVQPYIDNLQDMPTSDMPYLMQHIATGIFKVDDVNKIPDHALSERKEFQKEGIGSLLCVRIMVSGKTYGFIGCDIIGRTYTWNAFDIEYLKRIGEMLGNTLQNLYNQRALQEVQSALLEANRQLEQLANIDGLTGIANRRLFNSTLEKDIAEAAQHKASLSLLLIDVDAFKLFNDRYGHVAGDEVLKEVTATLCDSCLGNDDLVARYGGEEFAVILPNTNAEQALKVASRIVRKVREQNIPHLGSTHDSRLTVSAGLVTAALTAPVSGSVLVDKADKALYRAKEAGRNCVRVSEFS